MNSNRPESSEGRKRITHMTNARGEIDYGHAWRYYCMGFTDEYGRSKPICRGGGGWTYLSNKERAGRMDKDYMTTDKLTDKVTDGLRCCKEWGVCESSCAENGCPYEDDELNCIRNLHEDAEDLIGRLERSNNELLKTVLRSGGRVIEKNEVETAFAIIEKSLDALTEAGNVVANEMLRASADGLLGLRHFLSSLFRRNEPCDEEDKAKWEALTTHE